MCRVRMNIFVIWEKGKFVPLKQGVTAVFVNQFSFMEAAPLKIKRHHNFAVKTNYCDKLK